MRTVDVADYFGDGHPVPGGCNRMYAEMMRSLARVGRVVVDFSGVRSVPDTFLDATVGQVAYDCGSSFLRARAWTSWARRPARRRRPTAP